MQKDREILEGELVREEHHEQSRMKPPEQALREAEIADRKCIREKKYKQAMILKHQKQARCQVKLT